MNKRVKYTKGFDPTKYVNSETGESLFDELSGAALKQEVETGMFTVESKEYVIMDSKGLTLICSELSASDCAKFTQMANWLKTQFNIVYNNNIPHTLETLSEALEINRDNTTKLINRLVKKGLMAYVVCAPAGHVKKIYMMNPSVARKRKTFDNELLRFFKNYNKKEQSPDNPNKGIVK